MKLFVSDISSLIRSFIRHPNKVRTIASTVLTTDARELPVIIYQRIHTKTDSFSQTNSIIYTYKEESLFVCFSAMHFDAVRTNAMKFSRVIVIDYTGLPYDTLLKKCGDNTGLS